MLGTDFQIFRINLTGRIASRCGPNIQRNLK